MEFKEGQTYICTKATWYSWTEGKEYKVFFDDQNLVFAIKNDQGIIWYDYELNGTTHEFKLKEEEKMLKFEEGQTYICTKSEVPWWTEGKEYEVKRRGDGYLCLIDDDCEPYTEHHINIIETKFILKYEPPMEEPSMEEPSMEKEQENRTTDLIDNHTTKNQGIEPIDLMRENFSTEEFAGFLQGNVLKYMLRYKDKNGVEDLKKAKTYLTWLIEEEENENTNC